MDVIDFYLFFFLLIFQNFIFFLYFSLPWNLFPPSVLTGPCSSVHLTESGLDRVLTPKGDLGFGDVLVLVSEVGLSRPKT